MFDTTGDIEFCKNYPPRRLPALLGATLLFQDGEGTDVMRQIRSDSAGGRSFRSNDQYLWMSLGEAA